jgi:prolyl-tRNA synthetase
MRGREFTMKDGYSFHASFQDLQREYRNMHETYTRIFERLGLRFRAVAADPGSIGGTGSHEFHVLADSGEDAIAYSDQSDYAANIELAEALPPKDTNASGSEAKVEVSTPGKIRCEDVAEFLEVPIQRTLKAIAIIHSVGEMKNQLGLALVRGDHTLNEIKLQKVIGDFRFASDEEITNVIGCRPGYIGPVSLPTQPANIPGRDSDELPRNGIWLIVDRTAAVLSDFVCGANKPGFHLKGVNWKDVQPLWKTADIRNVVDGDTSPDGKGTLHIARGIEVGHIFQLRTRYSEAMKATFLDEAGKHRPFEMGCYGIGVTRIVGAAIEQNHDDRGIIFPEPIAPFQVVLVPIGYAKSTAVRETADALYDRLTKGGIDVLLDDRDERPGVLLADAELIGIPFRVVIGERGLKEGVIEYQARRDKEPKKISADDAIEMLRKK